jgi:hypothetical protein
MKNITIEWQHYDKEGETCTRCNNTGVNIKNVIKQFQTDSIHKKIKIKYLETKLDADEMPNSNTILINGQKLEDILGASTSENFCHSCSCLAGKGSNCRIIVKDGDIYEAIPKEFIKEAIDIIISQMV